MQKQLVIFNGGLSTKASPTLIAQNEAIECNNVDIEKGTLTPIKDKLYIEDAKGIHGYFFNGSYVFNTDDADDRHYVEFAGSLFWSNASFGSSGIMKYNGTDAGVSADPPPAPDAISVTPIAGGKLDNGIIYNYVYTFVDTSYLEGIPTVIATATTESPNLQIQVTINPTNTPADCAQVRIYRQGGANPTFNLVGEIDYTVATGSTTFTDNTRDIDVSRIELASFSSEPAPVNLDMLVENNGVFWGASGNRVYFSRAGSPFFWNSLDYIRLDGTCTGLGKIGDTMVAFTGNDAYHIFGNNRDTISVRKLEYNQGCKNKRTVTNIDNYLVWASDNGICLFNGSEVQVVSRNILEWNEFARVGDKTWGDFLDELYSSGLGFEIFYAFGYRDKYYGVFADGIVVIDISNGVKAYTLYDSGIESLAQNTSDNVLSFVEKEQLAYGADISFDATAKTITSLSADFSALVAGNIVKVSGSTSNDWSYPVVSVAGGVITVDDTDNPLTNEVAGASIYIDRLKVYTIEASASNAVARWKTGAMVDEGATVLKSYRKVYITGDLGSTNNMIIYVDGVATLAIQNEYEFYMPSGSIGREIQFEIETNGDISGLRYEYNTLGV